MKYMGSKNRIAKHILPIMLKNRKDGQWWVEPFVGGCNMIDKVSGNRIGCDLNEYVICLFKGIQDGFVPPDNISEEQYKQAQRHKSVDPLTSFIGFGCSYSGKWFGGYARGCANNGNPRNYCLESKKNIMNQRNKIKDVKFFCGSYDDFIFPEKSIIYCDPPYENTTKYKDKFNHKKFWQWCREMSKSGHTVFISEYNAPEDFECIWSMKINSSLTKQTGSKQGVEKLFILRSHDD